MTKRLFALATTVAATLATSLGALPAWAVEVSFTPVARKLTGRVFGVTLA